MMSGRKCDDKRIFAIEMDKFDSLHYYGVVLPLIKKHEEIRRLNAIKKVGNNDMSVRAIMNRQNIGTREESISELESAINDFTDIFTAMDKSTDPYGLLFRTDYDIRNYYHKGRHTGYNGPVPNPSTGVNELTARIAHEYAIRLIRTQNIEQFSQ